MVTMTDSRGSTAILQTGKHRLSGDDVLFFGLANNMAMVTPEKMRELLPYFQRFAETGSLL